MSVILRTQNLSTGYNRGPAGKILAKNLNLELSSGCLVSLIGANGSGKSTLLKTLCGLLPPQTGDVYYRGNLLAAIPRKTLAQSLAVVLTETPDLGNMSVWDLVALGRHPHLGFLSSLETKDSQKVNEALEKVGVAHLSGRLFMELSDGEKQKAQIARALAQEPDLLILDEPTAFLDLPGRVEILSLLSRLAREEKITLIMSTHELDLALRVSDEIWLLEKEGVLCRGIPEELMLSGTIPRAFASETYFFHQDLGTVELKRPVCGSVRLLGEGPAFLWTRRLLSRRGFEIVEDPERPLLEIKTEGQGRPIWEWHTSEGVKTFSNLIELDREWGRAP